MRHSVRVLWFWLGVNALLAGGYAIASNMAAEGLAVALIVLVGISTAIALCRSALRKRSRPKWPLFAAAALALCAARGVSAGSRDHEDPILAASRGAAHGVVELEVVGASVEHDRCEFSASLGSDGVVVRVMAPPKTCPVSEGQRVSVIAKDLVPRGRLPGGHDPQQQARRRGADAAIDVEHAWPGEGSRSLYWRTVARARSGVWAGTRSSDSRAFLAASVLGLRSALSPQRRAQLRRAGLGHLIAVSGIHVASVALLIYVVALRLTALAGRTPRAAYVLMLVPMIAYVGLTGASAPAVRAALMLTLAGAGHALGRPTHSLVGLAVACALMLAVRPAWATDPGFQMSVAAMSALVRGPAGAGLLSQTWRVTWGILPLSIWHFGSTGGYAVLANLIAIPVFTVWVLPLGIVGWLLVPGVGTWALAPAEMGARVILDVAELLAGLPPVPGSAAAAVAALALAAWLWPRVRSRLGRALPPRLACVGVLVVVMLPDPPANVPPWRFAVVRSAELHKVATGVCIRDPGSPAYAWANVVRGLGGEAVTNVVSRYGYEDPHTVDVRRSLARGGLWRPAAGVCPRLPAPCRRAIQNACSGDAGVADSHGLHCFKPGGWAWLPLPASCR